MIFLTESPSVKLAVSLRPPWIGVTFTPGISLFRGRLRILLGDLMLTRDYIILNNRTLLFWSLLACAGSVLKRVCHLRTEQ